MPLAPSADTLQFLRQVSAFSLLEDADLEFLAGQSEVLHFHIGQVVCRAGDPGDSLYLVYSGRARVIAAAPEGETTVGTLSRGDHFGEQALLTGAPRAFTVRAAEELTLLRLAREAFQAVVARRPELKRYFEEHVADLTTRNFLRMCSTFRTLKPAEIQGILDHLEQREFEAGEVVFRQGDPGDRFYLVRSGRARVVQDGREIARMTEGEFFGELALLHREPRAAGIVAETALSTLSLSSESFTRLLEQFPRLRESIETVAHSYRRLPPDLDRKPSRPAAVVEPGEPPDGGPEPDSASNGRRRRSRKTPIVLQIGQMDCGVACLAMVGKYYGREYRAQTLRELSEVGRDGASLRSLAETAERLGFRSRPVRAEFQHLQRGVHPTIVHWGGNHWVVLYEITPRIVIVGDPASGLRKYSHEEFRKSWTGIALVLEPSGELAPSEAKQGLIGRFVPFVLPYWPMLLEVLACSVVLQVLGLAGPLLTQAIVDRVIVHRDVPLLNLILVGMAVVVVFQVLATVLRQYLLVHTVRRIDLAMSVQFLAHVLRLPTRYFENIRVGDVVTRFGQTATVRRLLTGTATTLILDVLTVLIYGIAMLAMNAGLALVILLVVPAMGLLSMALTPLLRTTFHQTMEAQAEVQSHLVETIGGVQAIKTLIAERPVRWKWEELLVKQIRLEFRGMQLHLALDSMGIILQAVLNTALLGYGALLVIRGSLSLGQLMAFAALASVLTTAILRIIGVWDEVQDVRVALERVADILGTRPEEPRGEATLPTLPPVNGHIRFEKVTFRYSEQASTNAVENIDLEILPGQTVALVGRSGCGKSTLIKLLMRLYEPTSGRITVDGQPIDKVNLPSWRTQVGAVLQESVLFSGSIRENIALGQPQATGEQVRRAATLAGAHDFVSELPLGYNTLIGERGTTLSGGQRQRINIARALLADPRILILDEATSALDTESERAIQRNMETVLRDRTTLIIAHRLSTVRSAHKIVVMDRGLIVEQGTHEELMARKGLYFYLCSQQLDQ